VVRAKELAEKAATDAMAREEMSWDKARWDEGMAAARHAREIDELASERCHSQNLARHQANRARQTTARARMPSAPSSSTCQVQIDLP
jgi:hypothetical protein